MKSKANQETRQKILIEFGKHIKKLRKEQNMTQIDLSVKSATDVSKICNIEKGKYDFQISSLLIIAKGLNITVEELISFPNINSFKENILKDIDNY